ncbi:hypothetical protein [Candidatus Albibeggiatoa sp. nov. BB20]|uniref:hypothetical protein n=1 Tax=Candidatus Albibeggiatoa sp. nov. BB20 TaxID=3162723 RepID=UPI0033655BFD
MHEGLKEIIEKAMALPPESKLYLADLLRNHVAEHEMKAEFPVKDPTKEELEEQGRRWNVSINKLYEAGEIEKADKLKKFHEATKAFAEIDEPDLDIEEIYKDRIRNVGRGGYIGF